MPKIRKFEYEESDEYYKKLGKYTIFAEEHFANKDRYKLIEDIIYSLTYLKSLSDTAYHEFLDPNYQFFSVYNQRTLSIEDEANSLFEEWKNLATHISRECIESETALWLFHKMFFASEASKATIRVWLSHSSKRPGHASIETYSGGEANKGVYISFFPDVKEFSLICKHKGVNHTWDQDKLKMGNPTFEEKINISNFDVVAQHYNSIKLDKFKWQWCASVIPSKDALNCSAMVFLILKSTGAADKLDIGMPNFENLPEYLKDLYAETYQHLQKVKEIKIWCPADIVTLTKFIKAKETYLIALFNSLTSKDFLESMTMGKDIETNGTNSNRNTNNENNIYNFFNDTRQDLTITSAREFDENIEQEETPRKTTCNIL